MFDSKTGFLSEEPEVVFKFRHPDQQQAAEVDVRPNLPRDYRIKFKAEALPLKDRLGGYRLLFSHNVQFPLSHAPGGDRMAMERLAEIFPALKTLKQTKAARVSLVNQTIVEEVLQDLGTLDFGKGVTADANVALWRTRGEHLPLVGEFAFQVKFKRRVRRARQGARALREVLHPPPADSAVPGSISGEQRPAWSIGSRATRRRRTSDVAAEHSV